MMTGPQVLEPSSASSQVHQQEVEPEVEGGIGPRHSDIRVAGVSCSNLCAVLQGTHCQELLEVPSYLYLFHVLCGKENKAFLIMSIS